MALFAISDLHLSLGTDKPMDYFGGRWVNYVEKLKNAWCDTVTDEDTVIIPGDLSWAMNFEQLKPDFDFIESLPGKKVLMKGNHDYWWSTITKLNNFIEENGYKTISFLFNSALLSNGVSVCGSRGWDIFAAAEHDEKMVNRENLRLTASCKIGKELGGELVAFMHYPPVSPSSGKDEFISVLQSFGITRCYYGHIHHSGAGRVFEGEKFGISFKLISADTLNFTPIRIDNN